MDTNASIRGLSKKLNELFCSENKKSIKYSQVWLSDVDFGGLYHCEKFIVNVKVAHEIDSRSDEINYIATMLFAAMTKEEMSFLWRANVYNSFEAIHCESDELLVYRLEDACP